MCFMVTACDNEPIPDPIDPRVPKYTEKGCDVAGALVNDGVWESVVYVGMFSGSNNRPVITIDRQGESLSLEFSGYTSGKYSSIIFHMTDLGISSFQDLILLDGRKIQLDGLENSGYYTGGADLPIDMKRGVGQIYFKRASKNPTYSEIRVSGTFGFSYVDSNGNQIKVTSGRFDYDISEDSDFIVRW